MALQFSEVMSELQPRFDLVYDGDRSDESATVLTSTLGTEDEANEFVDEFSTLTSAKFVIDRIVYHKVWVCQHSSKRKKRRSNLDNGCKASIDILIKKVSKGTAANDHFLKQTPPLSCVIKISSNHSHPTGAADFSWSEKAQEAQSMEIDSHEGEEASSRVESVSTEKNVQDMSENEDKTLTSKVEAASSETMEADSSNTIVEEESAEKGEVKVTIPHDDKQKGSDSPQSTDKDISQTTESVKQASKEHESETESEIKSPTSVGDTSSNKITESSDLEVIKQTNKQNVDSPASDKNNSVEKILSVSPKCDTPETIISDIGQVSEKASRKEGPVVPILTAVTLSVRAPEKFTSSTEIESCDGKSEKSDKSTSKSASEHKKGDGEKKKKKSKVCEECKVTKGLKFQVLYQGKTRFLCSDTCFKNFKNKQKQTKPGAEPTGASIPKKFPETPDTCAHCKKTLPPGEGYYPEVGEIKPLCSDDCIKKYEENNVPTKYCSQCKKMIEDRFNYLTWETMAFCNEDCLGKYQSFLGSHCTCCQSPVQQSSLGKYCVCFGSDIKQFCSGTCLEEFKKSLKVCTFCQTDLSSVDGFLAPVGEKGQFKDFCTQPCMEQYEVMNLKIAALATEHDCAQCGKQGTFKIVVKFDERMHALCCNQCVAGFRYMKKIKRNVCETCCSVIKPEAELKYTLQHEGAHKNFCTRPCMTLYTLSHRKIIPCVTCKVKKYNFDMIEKFGKNEASQVFCSLNCLSLYRVSLNATSSKCVRCDHCTKMLPAQYHLTMSDGSIRNFCNYPCVIMFQSQFTNVPALTNTTTSRPNQAVPRTITIAPGTSGTPVISNVVSLASPRGPPGQVAKLIPQKMNPRQPGPQIVVSATKAQGTPPSFPAASSTVSNPSGSQIIREVIVKPPAPKSVKNKTVSCKPIMQTKGVSCKPHPCHKAVQTDDRPLPILIPVPIPVYIPSPFHMFSRPVPCPVPFAIPIPLPIIMPPKKEQVGTTPPEIKEPASPLESELLSMASTISENGSPNVTEREAALSDEEDESYFKEVKNTNSTSKKRGKAPIERPEKKIKTSEPPPVVDIAIPQTVPVDDEQTHICQPELPDMYSTRLKVP